jgi:hypothetical protein
MVETCESRTLLSAGIGRPPAVVAMVSHHPAGPVRLVGTFQGQYQINGFIPDVGKTYVISGSGSVHGQGRGSVAGSLHSLGFIAQGEAQGDLTLQGARGSVTLHLTGPSQAGFQPLPSQFSFTTTGGTGRYRRLHASGTATLTLTPGAGLPGEQGTFSLELKAG